MVVVALLTTTLGTGVYAAGSPVTALNASDIRLSSLSVNQGSSIDVKITHLHSAIKCVLRLVGPEISKPRTVSVKNSVASASLSTAGLPLGEYVVRAHCGKGEKLNSAKFSVIAKGAPTSATCEVVESGFSLSANYSTSYGAVLTNMSPVLTAKNVRLSITFKDGSGTTLSTVTDKASDISPGEKIVVGMAYSAGHLDVASLTISTLCESTRDPAPVKLRGQAQTIVDNSASSLRYPTNVGSQFTNTTSLTIGINSRVDYISRNASGEITGGGRTNTYPEFLLGLWVPGFPLIQYFHRISRPRTGSYLPVRATDFVCGVN